MSTTIYENISPQSNIERFKIKPSLKLMKQVSSPTHKPEKNIDMINHQKSLFFIEGAKQEQQTMSARPSLNNNQTQSNRSRVLSPSACSVFNNAPIPQSPFQQHKTGSRILKETPPSLKRFSNEEDNSEQMVENSSYSLPQHVLLHQQSLLSNTLYHTKSSRSPLYQNHIIIQQQIHPFQQDNSSNVQSPPNKYTIYSTSTKNQNISLQRDSPIWNSNQSNTSIQNLLKSVNLNDNICNNQSFQENKQVNTSPHIMQQRYKPNLALDQQISIQYQNFPLTKPLTNQRIVFKNSQQQPSKEQDINCLNSNNKQYNEQNNKVMHQSPREEWKKKQLGYISLSQRSNREIPQINITNTLNQISSPRANFLSGTNSNKQFLNQCFKSNKIITNLSKNLQEANNSNNFLSNQNEKKLNKNNSSSSRQLIQIVNYYDECKYNLNRFDCLKSSKLPNQSTKDLKNKQNHFLSQSKSFQNMAIIQSSNVHFQDSFSISNKQNISKEASSIIQLIKRITIGNNSNRLSLSPQNRLRSTSQNHSSFNKDKLNMDKSSQVEESIQSFKNEDLRLNGLSKVLNFSCSTLRIKDKKRLVPDISQDQKGIQNAIGVFAKLNSKIQQKAYNPFINKIGGVDFVEQVLKKLNKFLSENKELSGKILFDYNNQDLKVFIFHALGVKLIISKSELTKNLKLIGITYKNMNTYKQLMRSYVFEDQELIDKQYEVEFFRRLSSCEQNLMKYTLIEQIGGEETLKLVVETFHQNMSYYHPLYQKLGITAQDVYKGLVFLIAKEDYLETIQEYLQKIQQVHNITHFDLYITKKILQSSFESHGVLERPLFNILEILDALRPLVTQGYAYFPCDQGEQDCLINEISSDIFQQIIDSKEVQLMNVEYKVSLTQNNILSLVNILLRPYSKPYYKQIQFFAKKIHPKNNKILPNLNNLISSKVFIKISEVIKEYLENMQSDQQNQSPLKCALTNKILSNTQKKYSNIFSPFLVTDIKQKIYLLSFNSKYNSQEYNDQQLQEFLQEISPNTLLNAFKEYFLNRIQVRNDLFGELSDENFLYCSTQIFRFFLNQFIDDFPIRVSSYDIYTMIVEYKLTSKFIEKLFKILFRVLSVNLFPEGIIELIYQQYQEFKEFLLYSCNSQDHSNHYIYSLKPS